jgi:hypothetical protein
MSFDDFIQHFGSIYVCRILPKHVFGSGWAGASAAGPFEPVNNPQYLITVPKPSKVYIELAQDAKRTTKDAKLCYINFYVIANDGKRVTAITRDSIVGMANNGSMLNDVTVSAEVFLDKPGQPYTVVCTTADPGSSTSFTLAVFTEKLPGFEFKPFPDNIPYINPLSSINTMINTSTTTATVAVANTATASAPPLATTSSMTITTSITINSMR